MTTHSRCSEASEEPGSIRLVDTKKLSQLLDVKEEHLRQLVKARAIPHTKVGRLLRFDLRDIERWVEDNKRGIHS